MKKGIFSFNCLLAVIIVFCSAISWGSEVNDFTNLAVKIGEDFSADVYDGFSFDILADEDNALLKLELVGISDMIPYAIIEFPDGYEAYCPPDTTILSSQSAPESKHSMGKTTRAVKFNCLT